MTLIGGLFVWVISFVMILSVYGRFFKPDHVGIVEKVVDGVIFTVEGNAGDSVRQNQYPVGEHVILGFGVVEY